MDTTLCTYILQAKTRVNAEGAVRYKKGGHWVKVAWAEYYETVEKLGLALKEFGIQRGDRVAILANTRPEWAYSDAAAIAVGGVAVPIYQSSLPEDMVFILNDSKAKVLICENSAMFDKWRSVASSCPSVKKIIVMDSRRIESGDYSKWEEALEVGEARQAKHPGEFAEECNKARLADLITICYTSGTTGVPKGVMLTHAQAISEIVEVFRLIEVTPNDSTLTFLPFAHILGRVEHWAHIYIGWSMAYAENIDRIRDNLRETHPTFLVAVPRIFEKVYNGVISQAEASPSKKKVFDWAIGVGKQVSQAKIENRSVPYLTQLQYQAARKMVFDKLAEKLGGRLRFAVCGGAPLSGEIARFFHAANLLILEGYGLTETTAAIFCNTPYKYRFGTVGMPVGDVQIKIAEDGEILVKSQKVMIGYYNNEKATQEVLSADGWFATGDIGEITSEGYLRITDRKKDLIKTAGGKYVAPQKLENLLKLSKFVSNVLIHGDKKKYIVALLTLNADEVAKHFQARGVTVDKHKVHAEPEVRELLRQTVAEVNSKLASYESIKNFDLLPGDFTVESGEITPSLKVKRKFCDKKFESQINRLYGEEPSLSP